MTTTDAEAIARIIDPTCCISTPGNPAEKQAMSKAERILSLLASRREAQEPVAWRVTYADGGTVYLHHKPSGDSGVYECTPLYTAPPAPAGEVERLREKLAEACAWHEAQDKALSKSGRADADYYWRRAQHREQVEAIDAALNGGRSDG